MLSKENIRHDAMSARVGFVRGCLKAAAVTANKAVDKSENGNNCSSRPNLLYFSLKIYGNIPLNSVIKNRYTAMI